MSHLDELLCRYQAGHVTESERSQVQSHVVECKECSRMWETFRMIDAEFAKPVPVSPGRERVLQQVQSVTRRSRYLAIFLVLFTIAQLIVGFALMTAWKESFRAARIVGAFLIGDAFSLVAFVYWIVHEGRRLREATGRWYLTAAGPFFLPGRAVPGVK